jgi:hypothetical protein
MTPGGPEARKLVTMPPDPVSRPRQRYLRVSVRGLIVLVLVIGAGLGWIVHQAHVQRDAVAAIERAGGSVSYNWRWTDGKLVQGATRRPPNWLADFIGVDYVYHVTRVMFSSPPATSAETIVQIGRLTQLELLFLHDSILSDADLAHLGRLKCLTDLNLSNDRIPDTALARLKGLRRLRTLGLHGSYINDAGLAHLNGHVSLESLVLSNTEITDAGLVQLRRLRNLTDLDLSGTHITDAGLVHLKGLVKLRSLDVSGTQVTNSGLAHLKGLPNLRGSISSTPRSPTLGSMR